MNSATPQFKTRQRKHFYFIPVTNKLEKSEFDHNKLGDEKKA